MNPNCGKSHGKTILVVSCLTNDTESRYSLVKGDALALVYGLESCRMFVLGCPDLSVVEDHQPLTKIFSDRALENIKNASFLFQGMYSV